MTVQTRTPSFLEPNRRDQAEYATATRLGLAGMVETLHRWDLVTVTRAGDVVLGRDGWDVRTDSSLRPDVLVVRWDHLTVTVPRDRSVVDVAVDLVGDLDGTRWLRRHVLKLAADLGLPRTEFARPAAVA